MEKAIIFCLLISSSLAQEKGVMKQLSDRIGEVVLECQEEEEFGDDVIPDFLQFWDETNELKSQDLGCALVCVFNKMEVLDEASNVKKENTEAFIKSIGADDVMTSKILELFMLCRRATINIPETCHATLELTECFRYGVFQLQWVPEVPNRINKTVTGSMTGNNIKPVPVPVAALFRRREQPGGQRQKREQPGRQHERVGERRSHHNGQKKNLDTRQTQLDGLIKQAGEWRDQPRGQRQHKRLDGQREQYEQAHVLIGKLGKRRKQAGKRREQPRGLFDRLAEHGIHERRLNKISVPISDPSQSAKTVARAATSKISTKAARRSRRCNN